MDSLGPLRVLRTPTSIAVTGTFFLATYLLYRWFLPKPIPGIPFNPEATKSIFGDIPSMLAHLKTHKTITDWLLTHNNRHNSPIVQIFSNMSKKPIVLISDYREAQDILLRRTKEFDKPDMISDMFYGINPDHHTVKPSNDEFRAQRKLMQDLMAPSFLNGIAAPQLHANFMDLIKLWTEKMRLSEGHPFSVKNDIYDTALEAIWAAVFGIEGTATLTRENINLLSPMKSVTLPSAGDEAVEFTRAPAPAAFDAVLRLTDGLEHVLKSPFPRITGYFMRYMPSVRAWSKVKDNVIADQISKAEERMVQSKGDAENISNAVDHMLRREKMAAERQNRMPIYQSKVMVGELFGLLIAGHDTTSTTLLWALKLLAADQTVQNKLRTELRTRYAAAHSQNRVPSAQEIATTQSHYLDACLEEIIRCAKTATVTSRTVTTDALVLGHIIPKDSRIMLLGHGGGGFQQPYKIDDNLRSKTYHNAAGGKVGAWDVEGMDKFDPERWLVQDKDSDGKVYDSSAGPNLSFGGGPRGCFGKRMAYLELRIAIVLILWSFELMPPPERYASWEAMEQLTHSPVQCYVKLAEA